MLEGIANQVILVPSSGKWKSWNPGGVNQDKLLDELTIAAAKAASSGASVVLASSSFGCRVAAQLWADRSQDIPDNVKRKLICFGYPLFRPKPGQDRSAALKSIPNNVKVLLVSGDRDDFLNRDYQSYPKGTKALTLLAKECKASIETEATNGRHNPLDGAKKAEKTNVCRRVTNFVHGSIV